jgi:prephenate dehydrogenase
VPPLRSVGIVGYGAFGAFAHKLVMRFAPFVEVRICSRSHPPDGARFSTLEDAASSDAVVLATPIAAFEETLMRVLPHLRDDSVIVDVATVKMHTTALLKRHAAGRRYLATHPMFGPQSYEKQGKDVAGFRIVVTEHTLLPEEYAALAAALRSLGFTVVEMSAANHDKHLAETLFLTHFLGQVIARAGFDRTEIDTVSFGFLMNAVESVRADRALFLDVFRFNPYCKEVLERFGASERDVRALLEQEA